MIAVCDHSYGCTTWKWIDLVLLKKVKEASMSQNLLLNTQKRKIMVVDKGRERKEDFVLDGENIVEVESCVYLGSLINIKGSSAQEIRRRLSMGRPGGGAVQNMVSIILVPELNLVFHKIQFWDQYYVLYM